MNQIHSTARILNNNKNRRRNTLNSEGGYVESLISFVILPLLFANTT